MLVDCRFAVAAAEAATVAVAVCVSLSVCVCVVSVLYSLLWSFNKYVQGNAVW